MMHGRTMIDDLDLEDLDAGPPPGNVPAKFQKFIRPPPLSMHPESGMLPENSFASQATEVAYEKEPEYIRPSKESPTCLEVADHVISCPICSKFYKNDNSIYIIAVAILSIICVLLLKRVLNL
jgi:hypothetical protein